MDTQLEIKNLHVSTDGQEILHGVNLTIPKGEVHAIMGPNGSGKSTLAMTLMGHPKYEVTDGKIIFKKKNITSLPPDKRSKLGLFVAFQSPQSVPGVKIASFLRQTSGDGKKMSEFKKEMEAAMKTLNMRPEFADRYLNEGFSGGEKKKSEILQMAMLNPDIAILDEIDSGLDVDALKVVCEGVNTLKKKNGMGVLVITHYPRILKYLKPDHVHILLDGNIATSGDHALADEIEDKGYDWITA
ncbi:MAG: Fe-S cluster assembly ATPase SufC [Candidatus Kerfeldbacteria bacterium]